MLDGVMVLQSRPKRPPHEVIGAWELDPEAVDAGGRPDCVFEPWFELDEPGLLAVTLDFVVAGGGAWESDALDVAVLDGVTVEQKRPKRPHEVVGSWELDVVLLGLEALVVELLEEDPEEDEPLADDGEDCLLDGAELVAVDDDEDDTPDPVAEFVPEVDPVVVAELLGGGNEGDELGAF